MGCGRSSLFGLTPDEKLDCAAHVEKHLQKTLNALGKQAGKCVVHLHGRCSTHTNAHTHPTLKQTSLTLTPSSESHRCPRCRRPRNVRVPHRCFLSALHNAAAAAAAAAAAVFCKAAARCSFNVRVRVPTSHRPYLPTHRYRIFTRVDHDASLTIEINELIK